MFNHSCARAYWLFSGKRIKVKVHTSLLRKCNTNAFVPYYITTFHFQEKTEIPRNTFMLEINLTFSWTPALLMQLSKKKINAKWTCNQKLANYYQPRLLSRHKKKNKKFWSNPDQINKSKNEHNLVTFYLIACSLYLFYGKHAYLFTKITVLTVIKSYVCFVSF